MISLPRWFVVLALIVALPTLVFAEPMLAFQDGPVKIVIYTEDCALKNVVTNLPKRATWEEKGKSYEGCAAGTPFGFVMFYFAGDKTVALVPADGFTKAARI
jgi:hypothetical protein